MRKAIPKEVRKRVIAKYSGLCGYCGWNASTCIDHIHPVAHAHRLKHGVNDEDNLMPACASCNNFKHVLSIDLFRNEISRQVERARKSSINFRLAERFGLIKITGNPVEFYFELSPKPPAGSR